MVQKWDYLRKSAVVAKDFLWQWKDGKLRMEWHLD